MTSRNIWFPREELKADRVGQAQKMLADAFKGVGQTVGGAVDQIGQSAKDDRLGWAKAQLDQTMGQFREPPPPADFDPTEPPLSNSRIREPEPEPAPEPAPERNLVQQAGDRFSDLGTAAHNLGFRAPGQDGKGILGNTGLGEQVRAADQWSQANTPTPRSLSADDGLLGKQGPLQKALDPDVSQDSNLAGLKLGLETTGYPAMAKGAVRTGGDWLKSLDTLGTGLDKVTDRDSTLQERGQGALETGMGAIGAVAPQFTYIGNVAAERAKEQGLSDAQAETVGAVVGFLTPGGGTEQLGKAGAYLNRAQPLTRAGRLGGAAETFARTTGNLAETPEQLAKLGRVRSLAPAAAMGVAAPIGGVLGAREAAERDGAGAGDIALGALGGATRAADLTGGIGEMGVGTAQGLVRGARRLPEVPGRFAAGLSALRDGQTPGVGLLDGVDGRDGATSVDGRALRLDAAGATLGGVAGGIKGEQINEEQDEQNPLKRGARILGGGLLGAGAGAGLRRNAEGLGRAARAFQAGEAPGARERVIPPATARGLSVNEQPADIEFGRQSGFMPNRIDVAHSIRNTKDARLFPDGTLELNLYRYGKPRRELGETGRGGVFYAATEEQANGYNTGDAAAEGGQVRYQGPTAFRNPLFVDETGSMGRDIASAFLGKAGYEDVETRLGTLVKRTDAGSRQQAAALFQEVGWKPDESLQIVDSLRDQLSRSRGLSYALPEAIGSGLLRSRGYEAAIGIKRADYGPGSTIGEVFDVREAAYPGQGPQDFRVQPEFTGDTPRPMEGRPTGRVLKQIAQAEQEGRIPTGMDDRRALRDEALLDHLGLTYEYDGLPQAAKLHVDDYLFNPENPGRDRPREEVVREAMRMKGSPTARWSTEAAYEGQKSGAGPTGATGADDDALLNKVSFALGKQSSEADAANAPSVGAVFTPEEAQFGAHSVETIEDFKDVAPLYAPGSVFHVEETGKFYLYDSNGAANALSFPMDTKEEALYQAYQVKNGKWDTADFAKNPNFQAPPIESKPWIGQAEGQPGPAHEIYDYDNYEEIKADTNLLPVGSIVHNLSDDSYSVVDFPGELNDYGTGAGGKQAANDQAGWVKEQTTANHGPEEQAEKKLSFFENTPEEEAAYLEAEKKLEKGIFTEENAASLDDNWDAYNVGNVIYNQKSGNYILKTSDSPYEKKVFSDEPAALEYAKDYKPYETTPEDEESALTVAAKKLFGENDSDVTTKPGFFQKLTAGIKAFGSDEAGVLGVRAGAERPEGEKPVVRQGFREEKINGRTWQFTKPPGEKGWLLAIDGKPQTEAPQKTLAAARKLGLDNMKAEFPREIGARSDPQAGPNRVPRGTHQGGPMGPENRITPAEATEGEPTGNSIADEMSRKARVQRRLELLVKTMPDGPDKDEMLGELDLMRAQSNARQGELREQGQALGTQAQDELAERKRIGKLKQTRAERDLADQKALGLLKEEAAASTDMEGVAQAPTTDTPQEAVRHNVAQAKQPQTVEDVQANPVVTTPDEVNLDGKPLAKSKAAKVITATPTTPTTPATPQARKPRVTTVTTPATPGVPAVTVTTATPATPRGPRAPKQGQAAPPPPKTPKTPPAPKTPPTPPPSPRTADFGWLNEEGKLRPMEELEGTVRKELEDNFQEWKTYKGRVDKATTPAEKAKIQAEYNTKTLTRVAKKVTAISSMSVADVIKIANNAADPSHKHVQDLLKQADATHAMGMNPEWTATDFTANLARVNLIGANPVTMARNAMGGAASALWHPLEAAVASAIDKPLTGLSQMRGMQQKVERRYGKESYYILNGYARAGTAALTNAWAALEKGQQYTAYGLKQAQESQKSGSQATRTSGKIADRLLAPLTATDAFFRTLTQGGEVMRQTYRGLKDQGMSEADINTQMVKLLQSNRQDFVKATSKQMVDGLEKGVEQQVNYRAFTQDLDKLGQALQSVQKIPVAGSFIMPFVTTPYNAAKFDLERSVIGGLVNSGKITADLVKGSSTTSTGEQADRLARGMMGSALFFSLVGGMATGIVDVNGALPDNPGERDEWEAEGRKPYTIKIADRWVSFQDVPGLNATLMQAAVVKDILNKYGSDDKTYAPAVVRGILEATRTLAAQPMASGALEAAEAISSPGTRAEKFAGGMANPALPLSGIMRTVTTAGDPFQRVAPQPFNLGEQLSRVYAPENLAKRRTVVGSPLENPNQGLAAVNPLRTSQSTGFRVPGRYLVSGGAKGDTAMNKATDKVNAWKKDPINNPMPTTQELVRADLAKGTKNEYGEFLRERERSRLAGENLRRGVK